MQSSIEEPAVSVVMPLYNGEKYIRDAILSVMGQTLQNWELIIVDDASTDASVDIIKNEFVDDRITLISLDSNSGSGACRNYAINLARGKYIAILDADDISMPSRFERQSRVLDLDNSISVVASQVLEFGSWGGPIIGSWPTSDNQIRARQRMERMPVAHPSVMFRREVLEAVGGYDTACRRAQDFALFLKLSQERIVCIDEPLVSYRTQRPVSLAYVIRNDKYARLAVARHRLRETGVSEGNLPVEPVLDVRLLFRSFRNWSVRSLKEVILRRGLTNV